MFTTTYHGEVGVVELEHSLALQCLQEVFFETKLVATHVTLL